MSESFLLVSSENQSVSYIRAPSSGVKTGRTVWLQYFVWPLERLVARTCS